MTGIIPGRDPVSKRLAVSPLIILEPTADLTRGETVPTERSPERAKTAEELRLDEARERGTPWKQWALISVSANGHGP